MHWNVTLPLLIVAGSAGWLVWIRRHYSGGTGPQPSGFRSNMSIGLADFRGWWQRLMERWQHHQDRPRGPGPDGPAVASDPAKPVPLPPPPATLPPPEAGAPASAPSAGGAQSDLLYAIDALAAELYHGDIKAVRRVTATFSQIVTGVGGALSRSGTRLSDQDKDYGSEIFEGFMRVGAMCRAGGMILAESDASLLSLISATVGELADSPRRAPHSSQLNGGNR